jgi:hypothetical protein
MYDKAMKYFSLRSSQKHPLYLLLPADTPYLAVSISFILPSLLPCTVWERLISIYSYRISLNRTSLAILSTSAASLSSLCD